MGMQPEDTGEMARRRAILTDRERELIASDDDEEKEYQYQAASRIRNKIHDELTVDIEILEENHPELLGELREVVCEDRDGEGKGEH